MENVAVKRAYVTRCWVCNVGDTIDLSGRKCDDEWRVLSVQFSGRGLGMM